MAEANSWTNESSTEIRMVIHVLVGFHVDGVAMLSEASSSSIEPFKNKEESTPSTSTYQRIYTRPRAS